MTHSYSQPVHTSNLCSYCLHIMGEQVSQIVMCEYSLYQKASVEFEIHFSLGQSRQMAEFTCVNPIGIKFVAEN